MKIILVRHGQTEGNREHRFIGGRSDEPVTKEGILTLEKRIYPKVEHVFSSPMKRCIQTAKVVFGEEDPEIIEEFRECDFGILEGKTHEELMGDHLYDTFVESGGGLPFPEGEAIPDFNARCVKALQKAVEIAGERGYQSIGCTVHGGVIMAVMSQMVKGSDYYAWNVENGEGYIVEIDEEKLKEGHLDGTVTGGTLHRIYT